MQHVFGFVIHDSRLVCPNSRSRAWARNASAFPTASTWAGVGSFGSVIRGSNKLRSFAQGFVATDALVSCGAAVCRPSTFEPTVLRVGPPNHHECGACPRPER